jgi:hypothetical protein
MPSGRRLDDGSIVRVLWVYSNRSRDRWGEGTIMSKIAGGVASANQALQNSNAGFKLQAAAVIHVDYNDASHVDSLNVRQHAACLCSTVLIAV